MKMGLVFIDFDAIKITVYPGENQVFKDPTQ